MMPKISPKISYSRVAARHRGSSFEPAKDSSSGPINEHIARMSGQWLILTILLVAWAGIAVWAVSQWSEPQHAPLTYVSGQKAKADVVRSKTAPGTSGSDLKIHLDLLAASQQRTQKSFNSPKNIFAPIYPGGTVMPASPSAATDPASALPQPTPKELAREASRRGLAQFRYLGYLVRDGKEEAILAKGNFLHITGAGETIEQTVLVKAVSASGVTLKDTTAGVEQMVKLAGDAVSSAPLASHTLASPAPVIDTTQALPPPVPGPPPTTTEIPLPNTQPKTSM
jgi:hypothetical protein